MEQLTYSYTTPDKKDKYWVLTDIQENLIRIYLQFNGEKLLTSFVKQNVAYVPVLNTSFKNQTLNYEIYEVFIDSGAIDYVVFAYNKNLYKIPYKDLIDNSAVDSPPYHIFKKRYIPCNRIKKYSINY